MNEETKIILYSLLPIIFMLHEFEEILFLKYWLVKDKDYLRKKFPKIGPKLYLQYSKFTTSGFVFAIAEEFIIISILTYFAIVFSKDYLWFTVFMGFFIHIIIHIIQWILYRRYLPAIISSILVLPYCIYGFVQIINETILEIHWAVIYSLVGILCVLINLKLIHYLGHKFSKWENKIK
jgi:hypothetical protein